MSWGMTSSPFIRAQLNYNREKKQCDAVHSLPELIEFNAKHNPNHVFGLQTRVADTRPCQITFAQLKSAVEVAGAWLVDKGATTGRISREHKVAPVALFLGSDTTLYIYTAALLRIGTPVLLLSARLAPTAIAHLLKLVPPNAAIINTLMARSFNEAIRILKDDCRTIPQILTSATYDDFLTPNPSLTRAKIPPAYKNFRFHDLDAIIFHSSGTTGLPKPIYHGQSFMLAFSACHRFEGQNQTFACCVSTLPFYHAFGSFPPALSLGIGMPFVLLPASVIPTAKSTMALLKSSGAAYMFTVPSILEDMTKLPDRAGIKALKELEIISFGGAPLKESVGQELTAEGVNILNNWGCTELGPLTCFERVSHNWQYLSLRDGFPVLPLNDGSETYRLSGRAPGWKETYVMQDLLVPHPHNPALFKILGRADDVLVLSTGEKLRPTDIESVVSEHPAVKSVLAFGEGRQYPGLLIELSADSKQYHLDNPQSVASLLTSLDPYLERGNSLTDMHAKISRDMLIFVREGSSRHLLRTDKGSLMRSSNYKAFESEIQACYSNVGLVKGVACPLSHYTLRASLRKVVTSLTNFPKLPEDDDVDFFEAGMDSLQATWLRRSIINELRTTHGFSKDIDMDFIYENSSITKLFDALTRLLSDIEEQSPDVEARRIVNMEQMAFKYRAELQSFNNLLANPSVARPAKSGSTITGATVLLTGSTGSLGCFILAKLAADPTVSKVICLNRPSSNNIRTPERQLCLMIMRGAHITLSDWKKVSFYEAELNKVDFGLGEEIYHQLIGVTHIIHNAWPVNFNLSLSSFEPHVKGLVNLIRLSLLSSASRLSATQPTRILFTSTVAVTGLYPILNPDGSPQIPEIPMDARNTIKCGYPEAKWVCEKLMLDAMELYGGEGSTSTDLPLFHGSIVRMGQLTGAEGSGAWNEQEYFPTFVRTAQTLKALPNLKGTMSWMPVNRTGEVITELLFSEHFEQVYHVENPARQSWAEVLGLLSSMINTGKTPLPLVSFEKWMDRVKNLGDDPLKNPAFKLWSFFEEHFLHMSLGTVILSVDKAMEGSRAMRESTALGREHINEYVEYWKSVGLLE